MNETMTPARHDAATYANHEGLANLFQKVNEEIPMSFKEYFNTCVIMQDMGEDAPSWLESVAEDKSTPNLTSLIVNGEQDASIHNAAVKINDNLSACLKILAKNISREAHEQPDILNKADIDTIIKTYSAAAAQYFNDEIASARSGLAVEEMAAAMERSEPFTIEPPTETGKLLKQCYDKATTDAYNKIKAGEAFSVEDYGKLDNGAPSVVEMDAQACPAAFYTTHTLRMIADKEKSGEIDANTAAHLVNYASSMAVAIVESADRSTEITKVNLLQEAANAKFMLNLHMLNGEVDAKTAQEIMDFHLDSYVTVLANPKNVSINEAAYKAYADKYAPKELPNKVSTSLTNDPYQKPAALLPMKDAPDAEKPEKEATKQKATKDKGVGRD